MRRSRNSFPLEAPVRGLRNRVLSWGLVLLLAPAAWPACSSDSGAGTGTESGSGGAPVISSTGGAPGTGGALGSGGAPGTGGSQVIVGSSGGSSEPGGPGTGGEISASGGSTRPGGTGGATGTGGMASGGAPGTGGSTMSGPPGPCTVTPVSPGASAQAKKLLCYIYSIYGNHVLSGQQETSWSNPAGDISWYTTNGMKFPAILGGDLMYRDNAACTAVNSTTTRAIAYWNAGGLPMLRYHMGMPAAGLTCSQDCYQGTNCAESTPAAGALDNAVKAGTAENTSLVAKLDYVAVQIKAMQDANVPVILALFHEVQPNGWFWWSKGTAAQYVALWRYAFNYLTATKGLTNIVWLMPYSGLSGVNASITPYFAGKDVVDLSGPDYQNDAATFNKVKAVVGTTMPIALHESNAVNPAAWFTSASPYVMWNIWAGFQKNGLATVKAAYADSHTITRDLVPNLK